jgi:hypothetical protein
MSDVPAAALAALRRQPGTSAEVHLVVEEDEYETKFGDGLFLYALAAFFDRAAAERFLNELTKGELWAFHVKTVVIVRDELRNHITAELSPVSTSLKDVLALLS